jgi:hypothetical protein
MVAESPLTRKMGHGMGLLNGSMEVDVTLKIEAGKYYRTRDGRKVGPMARKWDDREHPWGFGRELSCYTSYGERWKGGLGHEGDDLIAEWTDEPPTTDPELLDFAALAAQHGIKITVKNGEIEITYDGTE